MCELEGSSVSKKIVSLDLETTGVDHKIHRVWEIGLVTAEGAKLHYQVPPENFVMASPQALQIGGFYERFTWPDGDAAHDMRSVHFHGDESAAYDVVNKLDVAIELAKELDGATVLGANPHFDTRMLAIFLNERGIAPSWNHRHLDLGSFCAGAWGLDFPLSTKTIAERFPNDRVHTALGDAEWNLEVYRSITAGAE